MQDLAEAYRAASGDEIARLLEQIDSLTEEAQKSLLTEIARRGMSQSELLQLHNQLAVDAEIAEREWRRAINADASWKLWRIFIQAALVIAAAALGVLVVLTVFNL